MIRPGRSITPLEEALPERSPGNGRPFYCRLCGAGFGEYIACEMPDCELESEADALARSTGKPQEEEEG